MSVQSLKLHVISANTDIVSEISDSNFRINDQPRALGGLKFNSDWSLNRNSLPVSINRTGERNEKTNNE